VNKPVRPTEAAESEIRDYLEWYEAERSGLADRLWSEIQDVVNLISEHPAAGTIIPRIRGVSGVRRFPLRRFPFFVIYREFDDYVELVALAHHRRRPKYWRSRLT
jgi:toxin ParE1/3/4